MKKQLWMTAMGLALVATAASSGTVTPVAVTVQVNTNLSGAAIGAMGQARQSANSQEYIGCGIQKSQTTTGSVTSYAFCQARNAAGVSGICSTQDAALMDAIHGIADNSYLSFYWNTSGQCTRIIVSTHSYFIP